MGLFRGKRVYVDRYALLGDVTSRIEASNLDLACLLIQFYGGLVVDTIDADVTHVVVFGADDDDDGAAANGGGGGGIAAYGGHGSVSSSPTVDSFAATEVAAEAAVRLAAIKRKRTERLLAGESLFHLVRHTWVDGCIRNDFLEEDVYTV